MKNFRCEYISSYNSMQNWRKIGVKHNSGTQKALKILDFLRGGRAL